MASALLTQLEENAFLLADAITTEKTILQTVKNICKYIFYAYYNLLFVVKNNFNTNGQEMYNNDIA